MCETNEANQAIEIRQSHLQKGVLNQIKDTLREKGKVQHQYKGPLMHLLQNRHKFGTCSMAVRFVLMLNAGGGIQKLG